MFHNPNFFKRKKKQPTATDFDDQPGLADRGFPAGGVHADRQQTLWGGGQMSPEGSALLHIPTERPGRP